MRKFKFRGEGPVDVPALGLVDVTPNTIVEVEDPETADAMMDSEVWDHQPQRPPKKAAAKKAAAKKAASTPASSVPVEPVLNSEDV